jgi:hypothetical protein
MNRRRRHPQAQFEYPDGDPILPIITPNGWIDHDDSSSAMQFV